MTSATPAVPSYASGTSEVPLLGDTIGDNFDRTAAAQPDVDALVEVPTGRRWSYGELRTEVDAVALGLVAAGVQKGDRLGIWAPNVAEWVLIQYATAKLGVVLVNINPAYRTHELEYVLKQAGKDAKVGEPGHIYNISIDAGPQVKVLCAPEDAPRVAEALGAVPGVQRVLTCALGGGVELVR